MDYPDYPTIAQLVERTRNVQTLDELAYVRKQLDYRFRMPELRNALFERVAELLPNQTGQSTTVTPTANAVIQNGISYNLDEWLTFSQYAKVYSLKSTNVLTNWQTRGLIPADCVVELDQLNGLKLILNQLYKTLE